MWRALIWAYVAPFVLVICNQVATSTPTAFPGEAWEEASPESQGVDLIKLMVAID